MSGTPEVKSMPKTGCQAVPQERQARDRLRALVDAYAEEHGLAPPLSMEELHKHAASVSRLAGNEGAYADFIMVLLGNAVWRGPMAAVPYNRRILLLPQCLREKKTCHAQMDELGLLCEQCGRCHIGNLQEEAENMGYSVLVAEGTTSVMNLIASGKADAVIGVSCLATLEKAFPMMATQAIPGIAIPLFVSGCDQTSVDIDWVRESMCLKSDGGWTGHSDIEKLQSQVDGWFQQDSLRDLLRSDNSRTVETAISWLCRSGKRWRPVLTACVFKALHHQGKEDLIKKVAVATECFHKASLVHDDIEDSDDLRYGDMTLHRQYGIPIALNIGDFLIGEGYRLITESGASAESIAAMLAVAAEGHRRLCLGQGEELFWSLDPSPPSSAKVLDVFRLKTAPAFDVALRLGALCGPIDRRICDDFTSFSESLGIAYQIGDDIADLTPTNEDGSALLRPALMLALAAENGTETERQVVDLAWRNGLHARKDVEQIKHAAELAGGKANRLFEEYKSRTIRSINNMDDMNLKNLLRKVCAKILNK